jgi:hypothetical protein
MAEMCECAEIHVPVKRICYDNDNNDGPNMSKILYYNNNMLCADAPIHADARPRRRAFRRPDDSAFPVAHDARHCCDESAARSRGAAIRKRLSAMFTIKICYNNNTRYDYHHSITSIKDAYRVPARAGVPYIYTTTIHNNIIRVSSRSLIIR